MRRRNKGNYEPYNTNNGENHCYSGEVRHPLGALDEPLAKDRSYVMGFDSETPLTPMSATASRPRFFAFMMCSQSKMARELVSSGMWCMIRAASHQPLSFQWVTRVGSRGEEKKCKEISASALCASSPRRHRGGSATCFFVRNVRLAGDAFATDEAGLRSEATIGTGEQIVEHRLSLPDRQLSGDRNVAEGSKPVVQANPSAGGQDPPVESKNPSPRTGRSRPGSE
jgi:hypothetical protein